MSFPDNLKYTESHEWVQIEGTKATIGISDYAQKELGDIVFVELPEEGTQLQNKEACVVIESVKTASDVYSPIAGTVTAVNEDLTNHPELINEDCYGKGWIFEMELSENPQTDSLLDAKTYQQEHTE